MEKKYFWKMISDDGLLKDPPVYGPYYSESKLNNYSGYTSEEEALKDYQDLQDKIEYGIERGLVLVAQYYPKGKDR